MLNLKDAATTELYTLSLHDALPICPTRAGAGSPGRRAPPARRRRHAGGRASRSEEHTSELQSQFHLVCRLLLEKKKLTACQRSLFFYDELADVCVVLVVKLDLIFLW